MTTDAVYLAGPMRGYDLYNFPAFDRCAENLRGMGYKVISPAELDRQAGFSEHAEFTPEELVPMMREFMRRDLNAIIDQCSAIALMPGWQKSSGVKVELSLAHVLGLQVLDALSGEPMDPDKAPSETILEEAQRLIFGDRGADYGHPREDFAKTAKMWTGTLLPKLKEGQEVSAKEVGLCMMQVKISREVNKPKRDNMADAAGYAGCVAMIEEY